MSQDTKEDDKKAWDEFTRRPLKTVTLEQIENAFAKALNDLTGQPYKVDLLRLDLNGGSAAWFTDAALIDLKVSKETQKNDGNLFGA